MTTTITAEEQSILIVDGSAGIYCPQRAAEMIDLEDWGIDNEKIDMLLRGPGPFDRDQENDDDWYSETWDDVLNNATMTDPQGHTWTLYQSQDVWMVRDDIDPSFFEN